MGPSTEGEGPSANNPHGRWEDRTGTVLPPPTGLAAKAVTVHLKAVNVPQDRKDAAWAAYVAEYDKNSEIVRTDLLCVDPG